MLMTLKSPSQFQTIRLKDKGLQTDADEHARLMKIKLYL